MSHTRIRGSKSNAAAPDAPSHFSHGPIVLVFAVFLLAMFVIPTFNNVPVGDDWVYTRSVEMLVEDGRLEILDLSVVTLVFQVLWGALFSAFEVSFASTRLSTIALVLLSTAALYALCRDMRVSPQRAALGAAVYLFNPLTFGLAFTFMTDPHFTGLLVISTWLYIRGLRPEQYSPRTVLFASAIAALAFLVRQQGILIPASVGLYLLFASRWKPNAAGARMAGIVGGIPALAVVLYYAWLFLIHGAPEQQGAFLDEMIDAGAHESRILASRMTYIALAYMGVFVLPIALGAVPALRSLCMPQSWAGRLIAGIWLIALIAGAVIFTQAGRHMPYIPQYASPQGIGPTDLYGGRPWLLGGDVVSWLSWIAVTSSAAFILLIATRLFDRATPERAGASLLCMIGFWQFIGALPPSFHFRNWIISVDRYLLPLVPISVVLLLWALNDRRLILPIAWVTTALIAAFSIIGTRDFLVFQGATWEMAHEAVESGVPLVQLDAGASWDGYYLYDYSIAHGIDQRTPGGPWWTDLFGPATDSTYVVSTRVLPEHTVVKQDAFSSWMDGDTRTMYLLRKADSPRTP
ncbi:MAG TPA: glycosyltransferase family 39 protein [Thermomicrobiales bacterium]|nr:glycosyltransferase family 39 protein [Thermomicrobiales bacterium]